MTETNPRQHTLQNSFLMGECYDDKRSRAVTEVLNNGHSFNCLTTLVLIMLPVIVITTSETRRLVRHHRC